MYRTPQRVFNYIILSSTKTKGFIVLSIVKGASDGKEALIWEHSMYSNYKEPFTAQNNILNGHAKRME